MILSGEIHYARVPRGLWRDRLLKLVRAGFNAVTTYFFWNYHEVSPGVFDFSGERDVDEFLSIASSLGLRIIARVGPYVCAEWDNGGHPDLLISDNFIPRSLDPSYFPYAERWLRTILAKISRYDPSRGGGLVALQLENEYFWGDIPFHLRLAEIARGLGITVELYTNANRYARNTLFTDSVDLYPDPWRLDGVIDALKDLEETQPGKRPKIMEYEGGWFSKITKPLPTERGSFPPSWTRMLLATALAYGADLINIYMFHGGTNFGYWTGRWITTTYDYEAAVREWGELGERYYKLKSLSQLAYMLEGSELANEERRGDRIRVVRSRGSSRFIFYINNTDDVWIEDGVRVPARDVRITVEDLELGSIRLSSNIDILAVKGDMAIFYGDVGEEFWINVDGGNIKACRGVHREGNKILGRVTDLSGCLVEARDGDKRILIIGRELAERTWILDYPIISNAYFVEDADLSRIIAHLREGRTVFYIPMRAGDYIPELGIGRIEVEARAPPAEFEVLEVLRGDLELEDIGFYENPPTLEDAGIYQHGFYAYIAEIPRSSLAGFAVNDLGIVVNGDKVSSSFIWWEGGLDAGKAVIYIDSTGHPNDPDWSVVPFKTGLVSPILLGKAVERPISGWEYAVVDLGRRYRPGIATYNSHSYLINRDIPMMVKDIARWEKEIPKISTPLAILYSRTKIQSEGYEHAVIRLRGVDRALVAMLNGRVIYKGRGNDIFDTVIYARLERGENELIVGAPYYGARGELRPPFKDASYSLWLDSVRGYRLHRILRKGGKEEKISGPLMTVDRPSTLSIRFKVVKKSEFSPIYTRISGNVVAQIMLNGIMVGRYYSGGSQDRFYLPEPYLSEDVNELTIVAIPTSQEARLDISFGTYYTARRVEIRI